MSQVGVAGRSVVVAGAGASGAAAARALLQMGAQVTVTDRAEGEPLAALATAGAHTVVGLTAPPEDTALVVTSPGWRPDHPLLVAAARAGVEVVGEVEFAWRVAHDRAHTPTVTGAVRRPVASHDAAVRPAPWLALTGTNGKTTTVRMLESMLRAAGLHAVATGNVGLPVIDAVLADPPYDVLAVELSSYQLHWSSSLRPSAAAVLNLAEDHLDWHGSMRAYAEAKQRIFHSGAVNIVNADDRQVSALAAGLAGLPTVVGFTLAQPAAGQLGVRAGVLVDRAFDAGQDTELAEVADVRPGGPHNVANALAAAALARAHGVRAEAVRAGLRSFVPDPHRNAVVATVDGVTYVDDSKATNPHAADASLRAYPRVVWIAGGQLKGARVDDLVATHRDRLAGVVLLGQDRATVAEAIERHAPDLRVLDVATTDDTAMEQVVRAAAGLAQPGDTVLLAPAAASFDMFPNYGARGDAFAAAVRTLADR